MKVASVIPVILDSLINIGKHYKVSASSVSGQYGEQRLVAFSLRINMDLTFQPDFYVLFLK